MVICPSSTPILNEIRDVTNWSLGRPKIFSALAKPIPWISPKQKIIPNRQGLTFWLTIFSIAVKSMDKAMRTSIKLAFGIIKPKEVKAKETLWAIVKTEHWMTIDFIFGLTKKRVRIKRIWSNPKGITCVNPNFK